MNRKSGTRAALAFASMLGLTGLACSQSSDNFYGGKTLEIYVGSSTGAGYDIYARLLSRHIAKQIPGKPTVVVRNMDGAGGLRLANWLYNVGAHDGLVLGTFGRGIAIDTLTDPKGPPFDARKLGWVGSLNDEVSTCVATRESGVKTIEDLQTLELVVAASGAGGDSFVFPTVLNKTLGTKMKIISGYPGGSEMSLAIERGEVNGRCGWSYSSMMATHSKWIQDGSLRIFTQIALSKHPDLPDAPLAIDSAKSSEDRDIMRFIFARQAMAWPFATPPNVPQERLETLRAAFDAMTRDPDFLADARNGKFEIRPVSGKAIDQILDQVFQLPEDVIKKAASMLK